MLGLGMDMNRGGYVGELPDISNLGDHLVRFIVSTVVDSGSGSTPTSSSVSLGDVRILASSGNYSGSPLHYTVTSLRIRNNTVAGTDGALTELITSELNLDSVIDVGGVGFFFYFFDNDSPMDDIDMGSASGHPQAHNGTGSNVYYFELTFKNSLYSGERTISVNLSLNDSDA